MTPWQQQCGEMTCTQTHHAASLRALAQELSAPVIITAPLPPQADPADLRALPDIQEYVESVDTVIALAKNTMKILYSRHGHIREVPLDDIPDVDPDGDLLPF